MTISINITSDEDVKHYKLLSLDRPCRHCQALQLDDTAHGGIVRRTADGEQFVDFGDVEETYTKRHGANWAGSAMRAGLGKSDDIVETRPKLQLRLNYEREDTLPDLPSLALTSQGCAFCMMLRGDVLSVWNEIEKTSDRYFDLDNSEDKAHPAKIIINKMAYQFYELDSGNVPRKRISLDSLYVFFTINWRSQKNDFSLHYNISSEAADPCTSWFQIRRRPLPNNLLSPPSRMRLNALISKSLLEIPLSIKDNIFYPTRLLDVGSSTRGKIRLIVPAEDPVFIKGERYAALSYCWGSKDEADNQAKTTLATIQERILKIEFGHLPQTVADAIQVCRSLGIRYLWVDALCIIQDDEDDWAKESLEMANVYANSFVTLSILQGASCTSGFLKRIHAPYMLQTNFRSGLNDSISGKLYPQMLEPPEKSFKVSKPGFLNSVVNSSPDQPAALDYNESAWSQRGWTFQEALLSPRKLFFGPLMAHISCGNLRESADGSIFENNMDETLVPTGERSLVNVLSHWYLLVTSYGKRMLTHEKDRLPAISAISRSISNMFPDQVYLAGLWKSDLHKGLLWSTYSWTDLATYLKSPEGYIAPTWSWAHRPNHISWFQGVTLDHWVLSPEFELKGLSIVTNPLNPYGRVSSGALVLDAKLFQLPLYRGEGRDKLVTNPEIMIGLILLPTINEGEYVKVGLWYSETRGLGGSKFWDNIQRQRVKLV
ncbi:hypothetical protein EKO27_g4884 [Xylaria grammica]|uniref:Heterokaryon incompatibility domain-containing protein n=1 Tax=Xylaria grammica TaxID=363999 RepID=A0A439D759_9PEZI|nr:hypothetical protein EKO27_g4884 [Xylaria grammica]